MKIVFHIFQCLIIPKKKKNGQRKTIFDQQKTLIKIKLIFYKSFSKKKNGKQSLSHVAHNSYKYYLLLTQETIFSFAHSAFLTINSLISSLLFIFCLFSHPHHHPFWPFLFPQISLSICLSSLLSPYFISPL